MAENKILEELRAKLTGTPEENTKYLRGMAETYANEGNVEGMNAASLLLVEIMPQDQKDEVERLTHLDGMRLDEMQNKIVKLINEKNTTVTKTANGVIVRNNDTVRGTINKQTRRISCNISSR